MKLATFFVAALASTAHAFSVSTQYQKNMRINSSSLLMSSETKEVTSDQPKYGNDLPLPSTYVRCGHCQASFALKPEDLGDKGKGWSV